MSLKRLYPTPDLRFDPNFRIGNCYTYALNLKDQVGISPGGLKDAERPLIGKENISVSVLQQKLTEDGLIARIKEHFETATGQDHIFACYVAPGEDYHFYRRHASGGWSHKIGRNYPSCHDLHGELIEHPETALRGKYKEFAGFYLIPPEGIEYIS